MIEEHLPRASTRRWISGACKARLCKDGSRSRTLYSSHLHNDKSFPAPSQALPDHIIILCEKRK